ncbi:MAG: hypothetical protein JNM84_04425 [Planctomycetes bacterium]|nr:hypothetical protein [Planctomycetota bacterium]
MHRTRFGVFAALLLHLVALGALSAQTEIRQGSLSSGTSTSSGSGGIELGSSLGLAAYQPVTSGAYELKGGFWPALLRSNLSTARNFDAIPGSNRVLLRWDAIGTGPLLFQVSRSITRSGPFATLGVRPFSGAPSYTFLDTTAIAGTRYFYLLSEVYTTAGITVPRALTESAAYGAVLPPGVVRVGPGAFASIDAAIAAAPPGTAIWTVLVDPGTYPSFRVTTSAPPVLQIVGDGTGNATIDSSTGPIEVHTRDLHQQTYLANLVLGNQTSTRPGLRVVNCNGPVIVDRCTIRAASTSPALSIQAAVSIAVQRCVLTGNPGASFDQARASMIKSSTTGLALRQGSRVEIGELSNTGGRAVEAGSTLIDVLGTIPDMDTPVFVGADQLFELRLRTDPSQPYQMLFSFGLGYVGFLPHELPLLADLLYLSPVLNGVTDARGEARFQLLFPSSAAALYGAPFTLQSFVLLTNPLRARFSNVVTKIGLP